MGSERSSEETIRVSGCFTQVLSSIALITWQDGASRGVPLSTELARTTAWQNSRAFEIAEDARKRVWSCHVAEIGGSGHDASISAPKFAPRVPGALFTD